MKLDLDDNRSGCPARAIAASAAASAAPTRTVVKKELVILIKPTVIQSDRDWERDLREMRDRMRAP